MIYAVTIFLSAFLLFMVQLIMGKQILPWFGGAPAVWTTCMLFFQMMLLAGYAYTHVTSRWLAPRGQARLHAALLALSLGVLGWLYLQWGSAILPSGEWKPTGEENPVWKILVLLMASVGLPFFLLSTTSPLLQRWFSFRAGHEQTYRLYAVSNAGSLLGLLSYPFLVERFLVLPVQAWVWAAGYAVFAAGCVVCGLRAMNSADEAPSSSPDDGDAESRPHWGTVAIWLLLAFATSAMLLGVTNQLCQEVATVPFLWVLPLALYLASFIICFDKPLWYSRRLFVAATAIISIVVLITDFQGIRLKIPVHIVTYSAFLFLFCMTCHGELTRLKPATRHLTLFYLMVALGGALGGVFVALLAPLFFKSYWEFSITLTLAWVLLVIIFARDKKSLFFTGDRWHFVLLLWFGIYLVVRYAVLLVPAIAKAAPWMRHLPVAAGIGLGLALLAGFVLRRGSLVTSRIWPRILVGLIIFLAEVFMLARIRSTSVNTVVAERNFFAALRIRATPAFAGESPPSFHLVHGQITHGTQFLDEKLGKQPVGYYAEGSGIETAVNRHPRRTRRPDSPEPMRIGVLGLGVGTMAAFALPGDHVRFYEINPVVVKYSEGEHPFFTYIRDCKGDTSTVLGDARLILERELAAGQPQKFDVLVMDAFSSDSVPVHLLTWEAFALYAEHLRDEESIIAVNISNRFLDFRDLIVTQANEAGFETAVILRGPGLPAAIPSHWMLLTRNRAFLEDKIVSERVTIYEPRRRVLWTDNFSNIFELLK